MFSRIREDLTTHVCSARQRSRIARGFTLVELMVVLAIMGILSSLLLVGVQASRDSARRASCANNLRNLALAAESHSAALGRYPAGRTITKAGEYSYVFELLPYLEQSALYSAFDRTRAWSDPRGNINVANTNLRIVRCPGAITKFDGKTDYGGIAGSLLPGMFDPATGLENGIMVEIGMGRPAPIRPAEVTDGQSHTLIVGEACDRPQTLGGRWISGYSTISHNNGGINEIKGSDLHSHHPQGANVAFADGRVQFLTQSTAEYLIGALCTRSGGETVDAL